MNDPVVPCCDPPPHPLSAAGPVRLPRADPRIERLRMARFDDALDLARGEGHGLAAARRLVRVYDGGAMPTGPDRVYLTHPAELDGLEVEGGSPTPIVDASASIPVVVLWHAPPAGDLLVATAVGGRWVAERAVVSTGYPCGPCSIPQRDLTVSWVNPGVGNGSAPLVYSAPSSWTSACTNQLQFKLFCTSNQVELRVYYFIAGVCPTGQSQYCSNQRTGSFHLTQTVLQCSPFVLTCTVTSTGCPSLAVNGYMSFTVTQ